MKNHKKRTHIYLEEDLERMLTDVCFNECSEWTGEDLLFDRPKSANKIINKAIREYCERWFAEELRKEKEVQDHINVCDGCNDCLGPKELMEQESLKSDK